MTLTWEPIYWGISIYIAKSKCIKWSGVDYKVWHVCFKGSIPIGTQYIEGRNFILILITIIKAYYMYDQNMAIVYT